jgi:hypothetical protein
MQLGRLPQLFAHVTAVTLGKAVSSLAASTPEGELWDNFSERTNRVSGTHRISG